MANPTVRVSFLGDASQLAREAKRADSALEGVSRHAHTTSTALGTALGTVAGRGIASVAGAALHAAGSVGQLASSAIQAASDMNESLTKSDAVFGSSASVVKAWAEDNTKNILLTKQAAIEGAATFGNLFTALGLGQGAAAGMSTQMVGLAEDLSSFNNVGTDEALAALKSGLLGEARPLREFGVSLSEARVQAEAYALGLAKPVKNAAAITAAHNAIAAATAKVAAVEKEHGKGTLAAAQARDGLARAEAGLTKAMGGQKVVLSDAVKLRARESIILKDTKTAQGDATRTQDGYANSTRKLHKALEDVSAELGAKLLPYALRATTQFTALVTQFEKGTGTGGQIRDDLSSIAGAAGAVARDLKPVADVAGWFFEHPDAFKAAAESMAIYAAAAKSAAIWSAAIKIPPLAPTGGGGGKGPSILGLNAPTAAVTAAAAAFYELGKFGQKHPRSYGFGGAALANNPLMKLAFGAPRSSPHAPAGDFTGDSTAHPNTDEHGAPSVAWNARHNADVVRASATAEAVKKAAKTAADAHKYAADQAEQAAKAKAAAADLLSAATDKLQQALDDRKQMAQGVHDSLVDSTSILRSGAAWTAKDLLSRFQNEAQKLQRFQSGVAGLAAKGFDKTVIQQAASGGVGNLGAVVGLAHASAAQVRQINATQRAIDRSAGGVGNTAAASQGPIVNVYIDGKQISAKVITSHSKDLALAVNRENARSAYNGSRLAG